MRPASLAAASARRIEAGAPSLPHKLSLELGQRGKQVKDQFTS